ncbi:ATP-binding cassette domain-containing protein [Actinomadura madurae]|uniref:branched-chain amino acid ABC transporter ATP-binding protein/permease n=1 Tax=Actinomadura madurae TaxID=1993 RepID=UPI00399A42EF
MLARARENVGWPLLAILVLLALTPLAVTEVSTRSVLVVAMIYATGAVGLDVLTGYSGQFSFGQFVYFAVGAYVMSSLREHGGLPWAAALVIAVAAAGLLAALVASALVRLKFFGSAVGTFFLGAVTLDLLSGKRLADWTGGSNGIVAPPVSIGGLDLSSGTGLYFGALTALVLAALVCLRYTRTRAGVAARVIKQNEVVAAVMGIRVVREKVRAHVLAGSVAGLGGCMLSINLGYLSPETFGVTQSIMLFAIVVVGGLGSIGGPILGSVFFFVSTYALSTRYEGVSELFFAVILLAIVVFFHGGFYDLGERLARLLRSRSGGVLSRPGRGGSGGSGPAAPVIEPKLPVSTGPRAAGTVRGGSDDVLLRIEHLTVRFGGVKALDSVSLDVRRGEVHAIIGPNGAGKTTLLNAISGIQALSSGTVALNGRDLGGLSVSSRRKLGISRTFQHPSLVGDLDVLRNVTIGSFESHDGTIWTELAGTVRQRRRRRRAHARAVAALETLEFPRERWPALAGDITMGEQKHVDIARAMGAEPTLLLLDEPTAGLGTEEMASVAKAIEAVRDAGVSILVIAHHVGFVRQVADRCTVLDFGKVLLCETPDQVLQDPQVREVFMGTGDKA